MMKRFTAVWLVTAMIGSLLGVSVASAAPKLRIGAHRSLMGSFEVIADRMGYWKEQGLEYTFKYFKQGKLMRNAIIQNNLDTGTTGFSPFALAISKGAKIRAIGVTASVCRTAGIFVRKNSKYKSIKDLKGVSFGTKKGTSVDFAFKTYVMPAHGLKESDLKWVSANGPDRLAALIAGSVEASISGDPLSEIAVQQGKIRKLEDFCKYDNTRMMHVGNPQTLKKNPELYVKYFRGWLKAHQLLQNDPEKYAQVYTKALVEVGAKASLKILRPVVKRLRSQVYITDEVRSYLNDMASKQKKHGWIKSHPDFRKSKWLDDSILRQVAKEIRFKQGQN